MGRVLEEQAIDVYQEQLFGGRDLSDTIHNLFLCYERRIFQICFP